MLIRIKTRRNRSTSNPVLIAKALGDGPLGDGSVNSVPPASMLATAALEKLGVWGSVSNNIAQAENVRAALLLVSRGEAPLGIVLQTMHGGPEM